MCLLRLKQRCPGSIQSLKAETQGTICAKEADLRGMSWERSVGVPKCRKLKTPVCGVKDEWEHMEDELGQVEGECGHAEVSVGTWG